jgi:hypothetical protein
VSSGPQNGSDGNVRSPYVDEGRSADLTAPTEVERLRLDLAEMAALADEYRARLYASAEQGAAVASERVRLEHHALDLGDRLEQVAPVVAAAAALCAKARPGRELHIDGPVLRAEFRALHAAVAALPVSLLPAATNPGSNDEQA